MYQMQMICPRSQRHTVKIVVAKLPCLIIITDHLHFTYDLIQYDIQLIENRLSVCDPDGSRFGFLALWRFELIVGLW